MFLELNPMLPQEFFELHLPSKRNFIQLSTVHVEVVNKQTLILQEYAESSQMFYFKLVHSEFCSASWLRSKFLPNFQQIWHRIMVAFK